MEPTKSYYVSWLGKLRYNVWGDCWNLTETTHLQWIEFFPCEDGRLLTSACSTLSPVPVVTAKPHRPSITRPRKDPFQASFSPLKLPLTGWVWSPLIGKCYIFYHSGGYSIWVPTQKTHRYYSSALDISGEKISPLWRHDDANEFIHKTPFFSGPQIVTLIPIES